MFEYGGWRSGAGPGFDDGFNVHEVRGGLLTNPWLGRGFLIHWVMLKRPVPNRRRSRW